MTSPTLDPMAGHAAVRPNGTPRGRLWAALELLVAAALVVGANVYDFVPVTETPWLVLIGWLSLRRRGLDWSSVGLSSSASRARRPTCRASVLSSAT